MAATAEVLIEPDTQEKQRSFDPCASVNMFRYDLENFGQVLPETRSRVCDEELSYLAEGIDRQFRTPFVLKREGNELVYFNEGEWQPYDTLLQKGLRVAKEEARADTKRKFLVDMRIEDLSKGFAMRDLKPGQRMAWTSPYSKDIEALYGASFMDDCGLQSARQLGFVYQAECLEDGSILLQSQTLDLSDKDGFAAIDMELANDPEAELDVLQDAYDSTLEKKYDKKYSAGRSDEKIEKDIWQTILKQRDLIEYQLDGIEDIASQSLFGESLEKAAKRHTYGVWAAFKKRIDGTTNKVFVQYVENQFTPSTPATYNPSVHQEVNQAFKEFVSQGRVLIGCGGSIRILKGEKDIFDASPEDVFSAIFGKDKKCPEIKDGQKTNCPHCKKKVRAIVPDRNKIFCSNDTCKLAAPGLMKAYKQRSSQAARKKAVSGYN